MQHGQVFESNFHIYEMWQFPCPPQFWTFYNRLALWASNLLTLSSRERFGEIKKRNVCQERKIVPKRDLKNSKFDNTPASGLNCAEGGCVRIRTIIREFGYMNSYGIWRAVLSESSKFSQSEVMPICFAWKRLFLGVFLGLNKFSQPNGRLLPSACHTYLESLCINSQF